MAFRPSVHVRGLPVSPKAVQAAIRKDREGARQALQITEETVALMSPTEAALLAEPMPAIPDDTSGAPNAATVNAILAVLRANGLIEP